MLKPILPAPSLRPAARRTRRVRPLVEGLEVRQVLTSLLSPTSSVLLNPQPLPPGSSPTAISYRPNRCVYYSPTLC